MHGRAALGPAHAFLRISGESVTSVAF